jgi:hypothetical protein
VVHGSHLFVLSIDMQKGLEMAVAAATAIRNGSKFSQCDVAWGGFP